MALLGTKHIGYDEMLHELNHMELKFPPVLHNLGKPGWLFVWGIYMEPCPSITRYLSVSMSWPSLVKCLFRFELKASLPCPLC